MAIADAHSDWPTPASSTPCARAQALILGLGFKPTQLEQPVNSFSGGWRMRLQLARALMCPSDLLLLDEPTNHLDLDALVWLEAWLQALRRHAGRDQPRPRVPRRGHQRHAAHRDAKLTRYGGNYSAFEEMRAEQLEQQQAAYAKQQDKIAHLQKFIDRFKAKATKAKQAQSRVKALERMEKIAPVLAAPDFTFEFREPPTCPTRCWRCDDVAFGYPAGRRRADRTSSRRRQPLGAGRPAHRHPGRQRPGQVDAGEDHRPRLPPLGGAITEGKGLAIGYFAQQEMDVLRPAGRPAGAHDPPGARAVRHRRASRTCATSSASSSSPATWSSRPVGTMSGGEKARLVLAMIVWQRPNLLLLDEPTNHLDLDTREALSMALNEFEGTVMLVSHDRALLRAVCDEFWLVGRGGVAPFDGDLDDYQGGGVDRLPLVERAPQRAGAAPARRPAAPAGPRD